ncbi:MAG: hypothetical protein WAR24_05350 [Candidatus Acidiferrales bacterium]
MMYLVSVPKEFVHRNLTNPLRSGSEAFATFPKMPDGITIRVLGEDSLAGIYAEGENTTTQHVASAEVMSIVVTGTRKRATKPNENQ